MDVETRCTKSGAYWDWVRKEAKLINSDGCTRGFQVGECCCLQHDLCFHYGKDPRSAFEVGWEKAVPISFTATNRLFASCLPLLLKYRFLAVQTIGYVLWKRARAKDALASQDNQVPAQGDPKL